VTIQSVTLSAAAPLALAGCPYRGLLSYSEADHEFFFGRERDTDLVVANMLANRVSVLCGPSGVGKSSLLQAGVLHELRHVRDGAFSFLAADHVVAVYFAAWRDDPLGQLGRAVCDALPPGPIKDELLAAPRPLSAELLAEIVEGYNADVYLLLDQVEELVLYHQGESGDGIALELAQIVRTSNLRASLLFGVREDALAQLDNLERHIPGLFNSFVRLDHLSAEGARQAIECPLERFNRDLRMERRVGIEPELVDRLLLDLRIGRVEVTETGSGVVTDEATTIETPFLQLVMARMWIHDVESGRRPVLRLGTLDGLGGAQNIVRTHLDDVMDQLSEAQRAVAAQVFRYLVTPSGSKIAHSLADLAYFSGASDLVSLNELLEELSSGDHRVLRPVPPPADHPGPTRFEIFHDVMAPAVLDWRRRYVEREERIGAERELVAAREAAEERTRQTRRTLRRTRIFSGAVLSLLVVVALLGGLILHFKQASDQADQIRRAAVVTAAQQRIGVDPASSLHALVAELGADDPDQQSASVMRQALDADLNRLTMRTDAGGTNVAAFSADGTMILTAGGDGRAVLHHGTTGATMLSFEPPGLGMVRPITTASFSADGTMVVTVTDRGDVTVYDTATGEVIIRPTFGGSGSSARAQGATWGTVDGEPVLLLSGSNGEPPELWKVRTGERVAFGDADAATYWSPSLRADGKRLVAITWPKNTNTGRVVIWDVESGSEIASSPETLLEATDPHFISTSSDAVVLVAKPSFSSTYRLIRWDGAADGSQTEAEFGSALLFEPTVSDDGSKVAFVVDKWIAILSTDDLRQIGQVPAQSEMITRVAFNPDGSKLVTGQQDGTLSVWRSDDWNTRPTNRLLGHQGAINDIEFAPDNPSRIVTASTDGTTRTWQLPENDVLQADSNWVQGAVVDPATGDIVLALGNGEWKSFDADLARGAAGDLDVSGLLIGLALAPDGRKIAAIGSNSGAPSLYDLRARTFTDLTSAKIAMRSGPAFNADGSLLAAVDWLNRIQVWDTSTGDLVRTVAAGDPGGWTSEIKFVPGSDLLAAAGSDGKVRLWDATSDEPAQIIGSDSTAPVTAMDFTDDGRTMVTVGSDRVLRTFDLTTGSRTQSVTGPAATIQSVDFSPDGRFIAGGASDGSVYVWSTDPLSLTGVLSRHGDLVNSVEFMPDGKRLLTASDDGTALVFDCGLACATPDQVISEARARDSARTPSG